MAAAATLAAVAIGAPSASAAGVVVRLPDRDVHVDDPVLRDAADVPAGVYTLRGEGGAGDTIAHPPAVSLPRVLELAGVAPDALSFVSVRRPNGTLSVLRAADLVRPAPFPDGPPLVWLDADSVRFLRPVRDAADVNGADNVATAGEDLLVRVHQGPLLEVAVRIAPDAPRAGERVHLEAQVSGARPGAGVTVRWRFGDGGEAIGPAVAHRWRRPGVYTVVAGAEGDDDSGGASAPVVVTVGEPRRGRGDTGGGSGDPDRAPAFGPREPPGDRPPAAPSASPAPPAEPPPAADADPGAEDAGPPAEPRREPGAKDAAPPAEPEPPARRRRSRAAPGSGGVPVHGVLVAATVPASARTAPPPAATAAAARLGGPVDRTDATLPAGGAVAAALLALGARRERRRRTP